MINSRMEVSQKLRLTQALPTVVMVESQDPWLAIGISFFTKTGI